MPAWRAWTVAHTQEFLKVDLSVSDISEALSTARSLHLAVVGAEHHYGSKGLHVAPSVR